MDDRPLVPSPMASCASLVIGGLSRYPASMSESAPTPIELPQKPPEQLAEIHELIEQVRRGDYSGTVPWDELAAELGL